MNEHTIFGTIFFKNDCFLIAEQTIFYDKLLKKRSVF